jgi:hypothetical protein
MCQAGLVKGGVAECFYVDLALTRLVKEPKEEFHRRRLRVYISKN